MGRPLITCKAPSKQTGLRYGRAPVPFTLVAGVPLCKFHGGWSPGVLSQADRPDGVSVLGAKIGQRDPVEQLLRLNANSRCYAPKLGHAGVGLSSFDGGDLRRAERAAARHRLLSEIPPHSLRPKIGADRSNEAHS